MEKKASLYDFLPQEYPIPGKAAYRQKQIAEWLYQKRVDTFEAMSNLPGELRTKLARTYTLLPLKLLKRQGAHDTTQKLLWQLTDGQLIESVLIPASPALYGEASDRKTLCLSTQVGCAYGCRFCASGLEGWKRNLTPGEIVAQILATEKISKQKVNNLVFMGMGEPLANYDNLMKAIEIINAPWGLNLGARHITISTSGLAPQIKKLADSPKQIRLAISLHGATDEVRSQIMPVNKKYPLAQLLEACLYYQKKKRKRITLEFILIQDINDSLDQAQHLAHLCQQLHAKVNLIPYNRVEGLPWERPSENRVKQFTKTVCAHGAIATVRREKGHDIDAACGQLRLKTDRELASHSLTL
ncbi:MAG: 23S rRNA (adenine(2503)-C(2))-methyltransferase RlmN [Verrucomicrobiia bacterium]